jgi:molybdenum cofactor cytidylyltransferase
MIETREKDHGMTDENKQFAVGVIILAAGASRRMGTPKLLLPWGGTSVLGHLLHESERLAVRQMAVVCATGARPLSEELDRLHFPGANRILNPDPDRGMFSSIQCAANWPGWNPGLSHFLITLGDQPHLRFETLKGLLAFAADNAGKICQPLRGGRRKHPVLLPKNVFLELRTTSAGDLKQFLLSHGNVFAGFESDDAGLDLDFDTPEDYQRVRRLYFGGPSSTSS